MAGIAKSVVRSRNPERSTRGIAAEREFGLSWLLGNIGNLAISSEKRRLRGGAGVEGCNVDNLQRRMCIFGKAYANQRMPQQPGREYKEKYNNNYNEHHDASPPHYLEKSFVPLF